MRLLKYLAILILAALLNAAVTTLVLLPIILVVKYLTNPEVVAIIYLTILLISIYGAVGTITEGD